MRILNYLLLAVLLTGCTSVFGQEFPIPTPEQFRKLTSQAEQGNAEAQSNLGEIYHFGIGVPQDYQLAMSWYRRTAEQGLAKAQVSLGLKYAYGQGVPQDYQLAAKWVRKAAEQGYASAQSLLGSMYYLGQGIPQDYVLAHKWVNLAAAQLGEDDVEFRDKIAKKMNTSQIQEAQKLAREFKPKKE